MAFRKRFCIVLRRRHQIWFVVEIQRKMLEIFTLSFYTHCALNIIFINLNFLKNEKSTKTQQIVHIEGIFFIIFTFISLKIVTTTTASTREENLLRKIWRKTLRNRWPRGRETAAVFYFQFLCNDVYHRGVQFSLKTRFYVPTGCVIVCWTNFPISFWMCWCSLSFNMIHLNYKRPIHASINRWTLPRGQK